MVRVLAALLLLASLTACQPTVDIVEQHEFTCDAVTPDLTPWLGQPLPQPQTGSLSLFLDDSPIVAGKTWGTLLDGDQVVARYDVKPGDRRSFVVAFIDTCFSGQLSSAQPAAEPKVKCSIGPGYPCKGPTPGVVEAACYSFLRNALDVTEMQAGDDYREICGVP
jgi:hypothetical protein